MFFRKGVLRFGKLTMDDTDLMIVDADPQDPFDFWLDRYNAQLVAGYSRNTVDHGLIVKMPDWRVVGGRKGRSVADCPAVIPSEARGLLRCRTRPSDPRCAQDDSQHDRPARPSAALHPPTR